MKFPTLPKLSELNRRERLLAFGSLLVISGVLVDRVVLDPWGRHTRHVHREIERLEISLRRQYDLLSREPQIRAEASSYQEFLQPDEAAPPDMAAVLREIEGLGAQSGITLGEVKPSEGSAAGAHHDHVIDIRYQGSLEQSVYFLYLLNRSTSLFDIQRATIARKEDDPSRIEGMLRVSSALLTAVHQPEAPAG